MVNALPHRHVHVSMLAKVTRLVKQSTLNVKTVFVMLVVLSAVLINLAGVLAQFSAILISLLLIKNDLISKEPVATFLLDRLPAGPETLSWSPLNPYHVDRQVLPVLVTLSLITMVLPLQLTDIQTWKVLQCMLIASAGKVDCSLLSDVAMI